MSTSKRHERLTTLIQRKLAQIIQREIRDPRLGFLTISGVELSRDLSYAKIYFTTLSPEPEAVAPILNASASYLRHALGRTLEARVLPELQFIYDSSEAYGRHIDALLKDEDNEASRDDDAS